MTDPLNAHLPDEPAEPLALVAEAYRIIAADEGLEMPTETRLRLLDLADHIESQGARR